uniref:RHS repeat-associated core domain-containing protein n=1 Tax=uncultured Microscilla sp. TaxID=432653 RepID=UPI002637D9F5
YDQGATHNYLNGNIGRMVWQSSIDQVQRQYDYTYDGLNRLKTASYASSNSAENGRYDVNNLTYDLNGNILTLKRQGLLERKLNLAMVFGTIDDLSYTYAGNQLLGVADAEDSRNTGVAGDFRDGHTATVQDPDYIYDDNGNLIADQNKKITSIVYNYLNLPTIINFEKNQQIVYTYDAAGIKLNKVVIDSTGAQTSRTDYIGSFVYENDELQFVHTAEGRALAPGALDGNAAFVYEYHYKDHLGNLRVAFREGQTQTTQATLEDIVMDKQQGFEYKDEVRTTDPTNANNHVAKLTTAQPLGMLRNLEVSKGDQVTVKVKAYYTGSPTNNQAVDWGLTLGNLSQTAGNTNSGEVSSQNSPFLLNLGLSITPSNGGNNPNASVPSGYLKSVFYTQDGTPVAVSLQIKHLQVNAGQWQALELSYIATERGYLQVFAANESDQTVFFDDMVVEHTPQLIVQENHYYPFGMNLRGIEKQGKPEHRWKFGGKEFDKTFGLNWGDFEARQYDALLGRWFVIDPKVEEFYTASPYNYALNDPVNMIDPDGKAPLDHIYMNASGQILGIHKTNDDSPHRLFIATVNGSGNGANTMTVNAEVKGVDQNILEKARTGGTLQEAVQDAISESNGEGQPKLTGGLRLMTDINPVTSGLSLIFGVAKGENIHGEKMSAGNYLEEGANVTPVGKLATLGKLGFFGLFRIAKNAYKHKGAISKLAKQYGILASQTEVSTSKIDKLASLMSNSKFDHSLNQIAGYYHKGKYTISEGHHRVAAALKVLAETGDAKHIETLLNRASIAGHIQGVNPTKYLSKSSIRKFGSMKFKK